MNVKKIVVSAAVASILVSGGIVGTSIIQAKAPEQRVQVEQNQHQDIELRVLNDLPHSDSIEIIVESRGDWPAEENCVTGNEVAEGETTVLFSMDHPGQNNTLLSYRYEGTLYQLDMNEFLNASKTAKLSDFVAQENDDYEYGKPHVCQPQPPQNINTWRQHPEDIPWGQCELEDGIAVELTFGLQNGEAYEPFSFELPERDDMQKLFRVTNNEDSQASIRAKVFRGNQVVEEFTVRPNETKLSNGYRSSNQPGEYRVELTKVGQGNCNGKVADVVHYQR